jgi:hypothetical protein
VKKIFKNTMIFPLWLAGLVIIAHLFIPHDHHSETSVFNMEEACHSKGNDSHHHSPFQPFHCHALNDLAFKNSSQVFVADPNFPICELSVLCFFDSETSASKLSKTILKDFRISLKDNDFSVSSPLRGPPCPA